MLRELEKYRFRAEVHRAAIRDLPHKEALTVDEKDRLEQAGLYGKYGTLAVQFPFVTALFYAEQRLRPMPLDKKVIGYFALAGVYGVVFMVTRAWVWHRSFDSVEDVIKKYVESVTIEDLKKINDERDLGILRPDKDKVYISKD